jgi:hypothetical protein
MLNIAQQKKENPKIPPIKWLEISDKTEASCHTEKPFGTKNPLTLSLHFGHTFKK